MTTIIVVCVVYVIVYIIGVVVVGIVGSKRELPEDGSDPTALDYIAIGFPAMVWPILLVVLGPPWLIGRAFTWLARRRP